MDGLILITILFPLNYVFIVRPLSKEIDRLYYTNQDLKESYQLLERFFSINNVLIAFMDAKFNFIRLNQAYADTDQRDPSYYIGKNHFELFPNEENEAIFKAVIQSGKPYTVTEKPFEYPGNPERGITYWDWSLLPINDDKGQVVQLLFALYDVTTRKRAQLALSESERRFRAVFNQTFQQMGLLDPSGNTLLLNQTALGFSELSQAEVTGKPFWQLPWWVSTADSATVPNGSLQTAISNAANGSVFHGERSIKTGTGKPAIMDMTFKPLLDDQGNTRLIIYEAHDITQRVDAERALQESDKEIKRLYHAEMRAHVRADALRDTVQALSGSLNSSDVSDNKATLVLTWNDNSINETGFTVQRMNVTGGWVDLATIASPLDQPNTHGKRSYTDTTFQLNTSSYSYRVVAKNTVGYGGAFMSLTVQSISAEVLVIVAPSNLTATLQAGTAGPQVNLAWTDNASNETGFIVQRSTDGLTFAQIGTTPARNNTGNVTYIDTTVNPGTTYYYQVAAEVTGRGSSTFSPIARVTLPVAPADPINLVTVNGPNGNGISRSVNLTWASSTTNVTGLTIQRATNATFTNGVTTATVGAGVTTLTQTGLSRNTVYFYRIRANNGAFVTSAWVSATPLSITTNP